jgi:hypothetical protein
MGDFARWVYRPGRNAGGNSDASRLQVRGPLNRDAQYFSRVRGAERHPQYHSSGRDAAGAVSVAIRSERIRMIGLDENPPYLFMNGDAPVPGASLVRKVCDS